MKQSELGKKYLYDWIDKMERMNKLAFEDKKHFCIICGMSPTLLKENVDNLITQELEAYKQELIDKIGFMGIDGNINYIGGYNQAIQDVIDLIKEEK